jgi:hypothetical protein
MTLPGVVAAAMLVGVITYASSVAPTSVKPINEADVGVFHWFCGPWLISWLVDRPGLHPPSGDRG